MRRAGVIQNTAAETRWWRNLQIVRECEERRLGWERRFSPPRSACPYGCDGSGGRAVEDDEDQTPRFLEIVYGGKLYTPCECNMKGRQTVRRPFEA